MPDTEKALAGLKGVEKYEVKWVGDKRATVTFLYRKGETTVEELLRAVRKSNGMFDVSVGEPDKLPLDFRAISVSGSFSIPDILVRGKRTIVYFTRDIDFDSMMFGMTLDGLGQRRRCAVRKISLDGPGAQAQFDKEFGRLPHARVYGADGSFLGDGSSIEEIEKACPR